MTISKEFRERARKALAGRYGRALGVCLVAGLITSMGASVSGSFQGEILGFHFSTAVLCTWGIIGVLLSIFVNIPLSVGVKNYFLKNAEGDTPFAELFGGFKNGYGNNVWVLFLAGIKLVLWTLLLVIPGIIKGFEYAAIPYILAENPGISSKDAFALTKKIMTGNKWRFFKLEFSFFGWILLACLTMGIGMIFLEPYMEAAFAEFYREVKVS